MTFSLHGYVSWLFKYHRWLVIIQLTFVAILATGITKLKVSDDFKVYFEKDSPRLIALDRLEEDFNTQDTVYFLLRPLGGNVFAPDVLSAIWNLTEDSWQLPYATRTSSLTNFQYSRAQGDDIYVQDLIPEEALPLSPEQAAAIRDIALAEATLKDSVIAENGLITGVSVSITLPIGSEEEASSEAVQAARVLRDQYRERYPDIEFLLGGSLTTNVILAETVAKDLKSLITISFSIISFGLWLLLRSFVGMLTTIVLIGSSVLAAMGLFGFLGFTVTPVAAFAPSIIMTIAVADSVHILANFFFHYRQFHDKQAAIRESIRINFQPVFFTSITTIIGVLALNFSESPPYQAMGNMVAVGVLLAFVFSLCLLPALLTWLPVGVPKLAEHGSAQHPMERLGNWVNHNRIRLFWGVGAIIIFVAAFIPKNELTEKWHEYFDESFEYRRAIDLIDKHLSGIDGLVYKLDSGQQDGVYSPTYLQAVEDFANWFRQQPEVVHVTAITDTLKRLNANMHGDDPAWYQVPDRRDLAAQYLLLYEIQLPPGLGIDTLINIDRSATRLGVTIRKAGSAELLDIEQRAADWLAQNSNEFVQPEASGLDIVFAHLNNNNIYSLLQGTVLALILISLVLILMLRSVKLGLASLVPNLIPAGLAYGLWGMFAGHINVALSVVIAMSLGIVVDDTVHFLSKYLRARREKGLTPEQGICYAFRTVGVALTITTVVLVAGFAILAFSNFTPTQETGTLLAITLAAALLVDFFFLPPLLLRVDRSPT